MVPIEACMIYICHSKLKEDDVKEMLELRRLFSPLCTSNSYML